LNAERVIVFARYPEAGHVKTRLIPALGPEVAARLQEALTRHTLTVVQWLVQRRACDLEIRFAGGNAERMRSLYGGEHRYVEQRGEGLGARLEQAIAAAFAEGVERLVVIGTDCPLLSGPLLSTAFEILRSTDVVLGPAEDGGYYLIGLRAPQPSLFAGIDWGTEHVLRQTLGRAARAGLTTHQLASLPDVDHPEDLLACRRMEEVFTPPLPAIQPGVVSIIIPTWNEEAGIESTLRPLIDLPNVEVIVADGGSTDGTVAICQRLGVRTVVVRPGRGRQMNAGAALARGEVLLFLHADASLPASFQDDIWSTLDRGAIAGAFRLAIDDPRWALRWVEWGANLRSRYLQLPYGDQGLFLRAETFYRLGGFPNWPLLEEVELCRRLKREGRIRLAPSAICTSARRWQKLGIGRTTLTNQLCIAGYYLGISPERLARWYRGDGGRATYERD
jgi:rSAM/selenodomain-associated transferase 2/rSAM/selenodomain-associated transferase 1